MFKRWDLGTIAFFVALSGLMVLLLSGGAIPDSHVTWVSAVFTLFFSGLLVWVTANYTRETTKIAEASQRQTAALQNQLDLDLVPKLLLVIGQPMPGSKIMNLIAVNLSRHQLWVTKVQSEVEPYSSPETNLMLKGGMALTPDKPAVVGMYMPGHEQGTVRVEFYYGPTGGMLHAREWALALSGEDASITEA